MEQIEKEFMGFLSSMGASFGMHDLMMKIFGILYIEPEEISLDEIAKKTGYSLASVSNTMKLFESFGGLQRIRKPKSKKVFFYLDKDLFKWNIKKLEAANKMMYQPSKEKLPSMIKKFKAKAKDDSQKKKVAIIENYYNQILVFEKVTDKWTKDLLEESKKFNKKG